jgi:hypothetical protein
MGVYRVAEVYFGRSCQNGWRNLLQINSGVLLELAGGGCVLSRILLVRAYTSRRESTSLRGASGSGVPCVLVAPVLLRHTEGLREDA